VQPFGSSTQFPLNVSTGESTQGGPVYEATLIPAGTTSTQTAVQLGAEDSVALALIVNTTGGAGTVTVAISGTSPSGYTWPLPQAAC